MADIKNCECCGAEVKTRYSFRFPNSNNKDTTKYICKTCHERLRVIINEFISTVDSYIKSTEETYPVIYPDIMNEEVTRYIGYNDYRRLEKEINNFIESGGI